MKILGIDPGSRITGYGIIESDANSHRYIASGSIVTKGELAQRLVQIYEGLNTIIQMHRPCQVAIEKVFVKKNVASALKLGHARGAAFVAVANHSLALAEYAPRLVKQSVVGYGGADKHQMQQMMKVLLCLNDVPSSDASDALAIALCHAHHSTTYRRIKND